MPQLDAGDEDFIGTACGECHAAACDVEHEGVAGGEEGEFHAFSEAEFGEALAAAAVGEGQAEDAGRFTCT